MVAQPPPRLSPRPRYTFIHAMNPRPSLAPQYSVVLDIGCGTRKAEPGAVGMDKSPGPATDIVWDLDNYPWPLESNRFERIHLSHIIEHVRDVMATMAEVHRVAQPGANVFVTTPHFSSHNSYADPTHVRHLAASSFDHLTGKNFESFAGAPFRFEIVSLQLTFGGNLILDNLGRALAGASLNGTSATPPGALRPRHPLPPPRGEIGLRHAPLPVPVLLYT